MKIAIVHDRFEGYGGSEKTVAAIAQLFPQADLFLVAYQPAALRYYLGTRPVNSSWLQPWTIATGRRLTMLSPALTATFNLQRYDVVISSSYGFAKAVLTAPGAYHICYCHTPYRASWNPYQRPPEGAPAPSWRGQVREALRDVLGGWDRVTGTWPTLYVANSANIQRQIRQVYRRDSVIVPPPVAVERFAQRQPLEDYFLVVSRLLAYKRVDLAVRAFNQLGLPLKIIGGGPELAPLQHLAGPTIEFLGPQPDAVVARYMARCRALIFPGEDDFGIVPVEAQAAGRPVIALRAGGALETVRDGETGLFFDCLRPEALAAAVQASLRHPFDPERIQRHARTFSQQRFCERLSAVVQAGYAALRAGPVADKRAVLRAVRHRLARVG